MENQKNNNSKGIIILLIIIIIILLTLVILLGTGTITFKSTKTNNAQQTSENNNLNNNNNENSSDETISNDTTNTSSINDDFTINIDELTNISKGDYNFLKQESTQDYTFNLSIDGKININLENNIANISNAKDIVLFSPPAPDSTLYILTTDGDIYKYSTLNYKSKDYNATKVNEYSNINRIITYNTRKSNAGGCDYIILIDNNNKYHKLDSSCN